MEKKKREKSDTIFTEISKNKILWEHRKQNAKSISFSSTIVLVEDKNIKMKMIYDYL